MLLLTTAAIKAWSPFTKKRGVTGRMSSDLVETISVSAWPTLVSMVKPRMSTFQVVSESGRVIVACPRPSELVMSDGFQ